MKKDLAAAHRESAPVLEETAILLDQKHQVDIKSALLEAAQRRFTLSPHDVRILTDSSEPVDAGFFDVLSQAKRIYHECEILLACENQRLGTDLMEQSAKDLDASFHKLHRWVQWELKTFNFENPQIGTLTRQALRTLSERPSLFRSCLDTFAESRNRALVDAFDAAMCVAARPIESNAHDPPRYVGDMLAWIHSAVVSEHESLETLFIAEGEDIRRGLEAGQTAEPWSAPDVFDGRQALQDLVNRSTEGICRLLKQKIEQLLHSHDELLLLLNLVQILAFYQTTFSTLLVAESTLLSVLADIKSTCFQQFHKSAAANVAAVDAILQTVPKNLQVPQPVRDILAESQVLLKSVDDPNDVLDAIPRPLIQSCLRAARTVQDPESSIFVLNCLSMMRKLVAEVQDPMLAATSRLVAFQHAFYLHASGLQSLLARISEVDVDGLRHASQVLDDFLPSATTDAALNIKALDDPRLIQNILEQAADSFCNDFARLEESLLAKDHEGLFKAEFPRTTEEIRVLLA